MKYTFHIFAKKFRQIKLTIPGRNVRLFNIEKERMDIIMNDENKKLFFDDDSDFTATITVTDENSNEIEAEIVASVEIEELEREFVALLPIETPDDMEENEALILEYSEDEDGEPVFAPIEDEEVFSIVSEAFDQFFADLIVEEEEEEESEDYLDNLQILPGVSIKKD